MVNNRYCHCIPVNTLILYEKEPWHKKLCGLGIVMSDGICRVLKYLALLYSRFACQLFKNAQLGICRMMLGVVCRCESLISPVLSVCHWGASSCLSISYFLLSPLYHFTAICTTSDAQHFSFCCSACFFHSHSHSPTARGGNETDAA